MLDCVLRCQPGVEARTLHQRARLLLRILHAQHAAALAHGFQNLLQAFQARGVQCKQVARVGQGRYQWQWLAQIQRRKRLVALSRAGLLLAFLLVWALLAV